MVDRPPPGRFRPPPLKRGTFVTAAISGLLLAGIWALAVPGSSWQTCLLAGVAMAVLWVGSVWLTDTGFAWRIRPR